MRVRSIVLMCAAVAVAARLVEAQEPVTQVRLADPKLQVTTAIDSIAGDLAALDTNHAALVETAEGYAALYTQLSDGTKRVVQIAEKLRNEDDRTNAARYSAQLLNAVSELQEMNSQLQLQFQVLQDQIQNESRRYATISNALTASHQAAMNAIRNMK
jgi:hypothetical protein